MQISEFSTWLDNLLEPKMFKDYCVDGLCVEASDKVTKIVTGVSWASSAKECAASCKTGFLFTASTCRLTATWKWGTMC